MLRLGILILMFAMVAPTLFAQELVFETSSTTLRLSDTGTVMSLREQATGQELLKTTDGRGGDPFAFARVNGRTFPVSSINRQSNVLTMRFGRSGVEADHCLTPRASTLLIELLAVRGPMPDELVFVHLPINPAPHSSGILNVQWDDRFAVCLMALDENFEASPGRGGVLECTAHREFGISGHKAVLIAVPTPQFQSVVQDVEKEFAIPHSMLGGQWGKTSEDVRRGYLFVDLTEANADEVIRLSKLGGFGAILIYTSTWSSSSGSYPLNTATYPHGEEGLKSVADKCHAAGLKVGIHTMTSFVSKNDPLVRPLADPRLLMDAVTTLTKPLDSATAEIVVAGLDGFSNRPSLGNDAGGMDVQIDNEIVSYAGVAAEGTARLLNCKRGANATRAMPHEAGAKVHHLAQRYNHYLADLHTTLKDEIAERIAGVINRCGLDMVYFDGGEGSSANGPRWYWMGALQSAFYSRVKRDVLVQGAGRTHWTWHFYSRGTCDDFAALAPKQYLDYHKIPDMWQKYQDAFLPAELGWWGLFGATPDHPATMPEEVEHYAIRMLALDSPVSLETRAATFKDNGRAEEMFRLLGSYEQLRLGPGVSPSLREKLKSGEWHGQPDSEGHWTFSPIRYDTQRVDIPATVTVANSDHNQPLQFRMQVMPTLSSAGSPQNIMLFNPRKPLDLPLPAPEAAMPGALAHRVVFAKPAGDEHNDFVVGADDPTTSKLAGRYRDLLHHRALAISLEVLDSGTTAADNTPPVLNVQLEAVSGRYREHYVDLDFTGERTIIIPEPTTERMLPEFRPATSNYSFKHAGYTFDYSRVVALNLRWMRLPNGKPVHCRIKSVEALAETDSILQRPRLSLGGTTLSIPATLKTGDYAEFLGDDKVQIYSESGGHKPDVQLHAQVPDLRSGKTDFQIESNTTATIKWTQITCGAPATQEE